MLHINIGSPVLVKNNFGNLLIPFIGGVFFTMASLTTKSVFFY